jgi:hypothetical protein
LLLDRGTLEVVLPKTNLLFKSKLTAGSPEAIADLEKWATLMREISDVQHSIYSDESGRPNLTGGDA